MKTIAIYIAAFLFMGARVQAQELELFGTAVSYVDAANGSLSYSIGELVVSSVSSNDGVLTQGFHQGFLTPTAIQEAPPMIELNLYPNPTSDVLYVESPRISDFSTMRLFDLTGKLLWQSGAGILTDNRVEISFRNYAAGTYFLRIEDAENGEYYSYSIVKGR